MTPSDHKVLSAMIPVLCGAWPGLLKLGSSSSWQKLSCLDSVGSSHPPGLQEEGLPARYNKILQDHGSYQPLLEVSQFWFMSCQIYTT